VVVDGVAIAAGDAAPHGRVERLAAAVAAPSFRREIGPVYRFARFGYAVDGRHDENERAGVEGVLDLALVGIRDADAGHRFGVRTRAPHARHRAPVVLIVLHLGPDEVIAGVRHGAVSRRVGGAEQRAAGDLAALHHLQLDRVPDLGSLRRVEGAAVLPRAGS